MNVITQQSKIIMDGQTIYIKDDKLIGDCYYDGKFIGTAIAKQLQFNVYADRIYLGKEFVYHRATKLNGVFVWRKIGTFIVTEIQPNDTTKDIKVTALDYMLKTHINYLPSCEFPCTLQTLYEDVLSQCELTPETANLDINGSFEVEDNQFEGTLCNDVIKAIAEITGNFATINENDELRLKFHNTEAVTIGRGEYSELVDKKDSTPITVLILENSAITGENWGAEWEDGITQYGRNEYLISDNGIAWTQEKREILAPVILDKIKGWSYSGFEMVGCFNFQDLELGDLITIENMDGTTSNSILLSYEYSQTESKISAQSQVKASINYNKAKDPLKHTEFIVNKHEGEISSVIQNIETVQGEIVVMNTLITSNKTGTDLIISRTGGNNQLRNSAFFKDIDYWTASDGAVYGIVQDTEIAQNTDSGSKLVLQSGTFSQEFKTIIGEVYTFICLLKNPQSVAGKTSWIRIYLNDNDYISVTDSDTKHNQFDKITFSYTASVYNPILKIYTNNGNTDFQIADIRIVKGEVSQEWTQYTDEVYGKGVLLDNTGLGVRGISGGTITSKLDEDSLIIKDGNTIITEVSDEQIYAPKGGFINEIKIGNILLTEVSTNRLFITKGGEN